MEYSNLGRKLGIGTRVAAKMLRERAQNSSASVSSARAAAPAAVQRKREKIPGSNAGPSRNIPSARVVRGVAAGGRGFSRGFWRAFSSAFRALWHQITGVFFALFAVFFAQNVWRLRFAWWSGPEHHYFVIYLIVALLFVYFSITAFVRGRHSGS
ncbi:MAG TPA: hypothetical protein VN670_00515 [Acidobacteriaceae bacterium]|nr:hypothetical protein [Acidobacteriaceae bacterium]